MNKYSLTFIDSNLENLFQAALLKNQNQVMIWYSGCLFLNVLANAIEDCLQSKQGKYVITFLLSACMILQIILLKKYVRYTKFALLISHVGLIYGLVYVNQGQNANLYIQGQNTMCLIVMIIFIQGFKQATIGNLSLLIFRIIFTIIQTEETPFYAIFLMTIIQVSLMILMYFKSFYERNYFLLGLQHKQWENIIPSLTSKPTLIFSFDQEQLRFVPLKIISLHFFENINKPLSYFLRQSKYLGNTLEVYLFSKTQEKSITDFTQHLVEKIKVVYHQQTKLIKIIHTILDVTTFIITIEDEDENIGEIKQLIAKEKNRYKRINFKTVQQFDKVLKKACLTKNWNFIVKLRLQYAQILLINNLKFLKLETFNITKMLSVIIQQFKTKSVKIRLLNKQEIFIRSIYSYLTILLLELMKNITEKEQLVLINVEVILKSLQSRLLERFSINSQKPQQLSLKNQYIYFMKNLLKDFNQIDKSIHYE